MAKRCRAHLCMKSQSRQMVHFPATIGFMENGGREQRFTKIFRSDPLLGIAELPKLRCRVAVEPMGLAWCLSRLEQCAARQVRADEDKPDKAGTEGESETFGHHAGNVAHARPISNVASPGNSISLTPAQPTNPAAAFARKGASQISTFKTGAGTVIWAKSPGFDPTSCAISGAQDQRILTEASPAHAPKQLRPPHSFSDRPDGGGDPLPPDVSRRSSRVAEA